MSLSAVTGVPAAPVPAHRRHGMLGSCARTAM